MSRLSKWGMAGERTDLEEIKGVLTRLFPEQWIARVLLVAPPSVIERLHTRLETSEHWQSRFSAFGLGPDDLYNNDFKNKHIPRLLLKGYSNTWAA
ncbi:MAG TPA: hypothetical protein QF403_00070 [Alphaproteobacteria bacterium]|nr:hypothetical protein [Alphaproteobacteria bacterium]